jgi:hypothetical protein
MRVKDIISHLKRFPKKKAAVIEALKTPVSVAKVAVKKKG